VSAFAKFILAGRLNAIFIAAFFGAVSVYSSPLSVFSATAIALVALSKGFGEAFHVVGVSAILIEIFLAFFPASTSFPFPVVFALWVPVLVGAWFLRASASQSSALAAVAGVCALFVLGMHLVIGDVVLWWAQWFQQAIPGFSDQTGGEIGAVDFIRLANGFAAMFLGFGAMFTLFFTRWMQAALFNPGGFSREFVAQKLPRTLLIGILVLLVVTGSFNQQIMSDLFMVSLMLYFFQGLGVLHALVVHRQLGRHWLIAPYLGLFLLPQILVPGMALMGVADSIVDFRSRQ
jgi:hypothetical protein